VLIKKLEILQELAKDIVLKEKSKYKYATPDYDAQKVATQKLTPPPEQKENISKPKPNSDHAQKTKFNGLDKVNQNVESTSDIFKSVALIVDVKVDSLLYECLSSKQILQDLRSNLKEFNAEIVMQPKVLIRCLNPTAGQACDSVIWTKLVQSIVNDFEKNRLREKLIAIPAQLRQEKEIGDLRNHAQRFADANSSVRYEISKANDSVRCVGYTKVVDSFNVDIRAKFNNLDNNIKDRIRRKLDLVISKKSNLLHYEILSGFNGIYFKDFAASLAKCEADIEKLKNENGFTVKCTNQRQNNNERFVTEWRQNLNDLMVRFFSKFSRKKYKLTQKRGEINLNGLEINTTLFKMTWTDDFNVELLGIASEIDKAINKIMPLNVIKPDQEHEKASSSSSSSLSSKTISKPDSTESFASTLASSTAGSVKTKENTEFVNELNKNSQSSQETFLISDLKWFQTQILFEKKYFQYVTETFKDLSVLLDEGLTRMFFTCKKRQEIELAKKLAFDILGQIMGVEIVCDEKTLKRMSASEKKFNSVFKQKGLCCVVDTKSSTDKYTIYATTIEEIEACKKLIPHIGY
jgi:hypothetical protein